MRAGLGGWWVPSEFGGELEGEHGGWWCGEWRGEVVGGQAEYSSWGWG